MTRGILFLGVPHHGSKYSLLARLMACTAFWRGSSTALLQFVDQGNKELKTLDDRFARIYAGRSGHNSPVGAEPYIANLIEMVPEGFGKLSLSPVSCLEFHLNFFSFFFFSLCLCVSWSLDFVNNRFRPLLSKAAS